MSNDSLTFYLKMKDMMSGGLVKMSRTAKESFDKVTRYTKEVAKTNDVLKNSYATLQQRIAVTESSIRKSTSIRHIRSARRELELLQRQASRHLGNIGGKTSGMMGMARRFLPALGIAAAVSAGAATEKTAMNRGAVEQAINFTTGGKGVDATRQILEINETLGMNDQAGLESFKTLSGSYKAPLKEQITLYEGLSKAARTFKLDSEKVKGAMLALSQMASKGKVSAEELRGQLAERIPGAFTLAADAMGVNEAQLNKLMETGKIMASDFLPKFAKALNDKFTKPAMEAAKGPGATLDRYKNRIEKLQIAIGKRLIPVIEKLRLWFIDSVDFIKENKEQLEFWGHALLGLGAVLLVYKVSLIAYSLYMGIAAFAASQMTIAQWALNLAMDANPIGLIVAALAALAVGLLLAWNHSEKFREGVLGLWEVTRTVFTNIGNFFSQIFDPIFKAIEAFKRGDFLEAGKQATIGLLNLTPVGMAARTISFGLEGGFSKGVADAFEKGQKAGKAAGELALPKELSEALGGDETSTGTGATPTVSGIVGGVASSGPRVININGVKFAETINIASDSLDGAMDEVEEKMSTLFLRLLNSAGALQ